MCLDFFSNDKQQAATMRRLLVTLLVLGVQAATGRCCDSGSARPGSVLSVPRSLSSNADVALLRPAYDSPSVARCLKDCCTGAYGACSVASFTQNTTEKNCLLFNCQPLNKCQFIPAESIDSFAFSSAGNGLLPSGHLNSPSSNVTSPPSNITSTPSKSVNVAEELTSETSLLQEAAEDLSRYSEDQFATLDDNTTVKPRKGVDDLVSNKSPSSGIKPRKGVSMKDVPHSNLIPGSLNKSSIKPRKGVEPYPVVPQDVSSESKNYTQEDISSDELREALEKVFGEDEPLPSSSVHALVSTSTNQPSSALVYISHSLVPESSTKIDQTWHSSSPTSSNLVLESSRSYAFINQVNKPQSSSTQTLPEVMLPITTSSSQFSTSRDVSPTVTTSLLIEATDSVPDRLSHVTSSKLAASVNGHPHQVNTEETESDRKYKSSIHLVLSLVFGLLVLVAVLGVVAKRIYEGWLRRDYYRMNYLIDGIYDGQAQNPIN